MFEQFKRGMFYTAIGKYSIAIVNLIINMVLGRLLSPQEFGVVAAVNIFLVFFQMLEDFGVGPAIVQNKDLTRDDGHSIFTFSMYLSIVLSIAFILLGYPLSWYYGSEIYIPVSRVLAICVFFYGALVVPQSLLLRAKDFKFINVATIIAAIMNATVSISLALLGFSYYSIILGNTVKAATLFFIFFFKTNSKIRFKFELAPLKKIYHFSRNQLLFNFTNFFSRNMDSFLIGGLISQTALGYYDRAYQLTLYPNQVLTSLVTSVIHPIMSEYENEKDRIEKVYLRISNLLALVGMPLSVFLFFASEEVVLILFGMDWLGSVPTFQILACSIWIQMLLSSTGGIFQSGNRTDLLLLSGILSTVFNITGIIIGILFGEIEMVALFLILAFSINFFQANYLIMNRMFNDSIVKFLKNLGKPFIIAGLILIAFVVLPEIQSNLFVRLLYKGFIFAFVWFIGLIITGEFSRIRGEILRHRA